MIPTLNQVLCTVSGYRTRIGSTLVVPERQIDKRNEYYPRETRRRAGGATNEDIIGYRLAPIYPGDQMYGIYPAETFQSDWLLDAIDETDFREATAEAGTAVTLLVQYQ